MRAPFPDPVLTASIYCDGHLDGLALDVVDGFQQALQNHQAARSSYLWTVRYGKGGQHLKLRLHGPRQLRPHARTLLAERVAGYLRNLDPVAQPVQRDPRSKDPPIDFEDEERTLYPDRTLLWTRYRRSHVSLGGEPLLSDDRYVALVTRCLATGWQSVVAALQSGRQKGELSDRQRQNSLLRTVVAVLSAPGFTDAWRADYLEYHRDWLVRFSSGGSESQERQLRGILIGESERLHHSVETLSDALVQARGSADIAMNTRTPDARLARSVEALIRHLAPLRRGRAGERDPLAKDPAYTAVFKVLHGVSNQLGLNPLREAFAYHLLVCASAVDKA